MKDLLASIRWRRSWSNGVIPGSGVQLVIETMVGY